MMILTGQKSEEMAVIVVLGLCYRWLMLALLKKSY